MIIIAIDSLNCHSDSKKTVKLKLRHYEVTEKDRNP